MSRPIEVKVATFKGNQITREFGPVVLDNVGQIDASPLRPFSPVVKPRTDEVFYAAEVTDALIEVKAKISSEGRNGRPKLPERGILFEARTV